MRISLGYYGNISWSSRGFLRAEFRRKGAKRQVTGSFVTFYNYGVLN